MDRKIYFVGYFLFDKIFELFMKISSETTKNNLIFKTIKLTFCQEFPKIHVFSPIS